MGIRKYLLPSVATICEKYLTKLKTYLLKVVSREQHIWRKRATLYQWEYGEPKSPLVPVGKKRAIEVIFWSTWSYDLNHRYDIPQFK